MYLLPVDVESEQETLYFISTVTRSTFCSEKKLLTFFLKSLSASSKYFVLIKLYILIMNQQTSLVGGGF